MQKPRSRRLPGLLASASLIAAPVYLPVGLNLMPATAFARGGGGNAGGHGGHGAGTAPGAEVAASHTGSGNSDQDMGNAGYANGGQPPGQQTDHGQSHAEAAESALASAAASLNAAHASPTALAHASPNSVVSKLAVYKQAMLAALAMPATTPAEVAAQQAAITAARLSLATATGVRITPTAIQSVDHLLGLPPANPALGTASPPATTS